MNRFDAAFLDDNPLPTKFRPPNLRYAYRAIDSVRRVNFQSGMRSYVAEQSLKSASAKSSRTSVVAFPPPSSSEAFSESSSTSPLHSSQNSPSSSRTQLARVMTTTSSINPSTTTTATAVTAARSVPVSRAVSSCDLLQQMRVRTQSNETCLIKQKQILEKHYQELEEQLNRALGDRGAAGKELQALKLEIEHVKTKIKSETKFLSLVVKALEGAVRKLSESSLSAISHDSPEHANPNNKNNTNNRVNRPANAAKSGFLPTSIPSRSLDTVHYQATTPN